MAQMKSPKGEAKRLPLQLCLQPRRGPYTRLIILDENGITEHPLGFDLPAGSKDATLTASGGTITFSYTNKDGVSQSTSITGTLPGHDGAGRKFTYFVRETLTGTNKDNYNVSYSHTHESETGTVTDSYDEGAPYGGTVTNTRREKAMVTVDKTWRNPEGLTEIDGASVQLVLCANGDPTKPMEVYKADEGSYEILTGDNLKEAQTATGFTETIPTVPSLPTWPAGSGTEIT